MDFPDLELQLVREISKKEAEVKALKNTLAAVRGQPTLPLHSRRGRKSMGKAERQEVSERMRRYWADRHKREAQDEREVEQRMRAM